ncbi:MAG: DUF2867 domain-containing protein [Desulfobacterales bacterium]|jgi:hypothetical protein
MGNRPTKTYLVDMKAIRTLLDGADYIGIKTVEAENDLEGFLRRIFTYRPRLVRLLYRLRAPLVRLLGFHQDPLPEMKEWIPEDFPMLPCGNVWLFTVREVKPDRYWIAGCPRDRHLDADMAVVAEPLAGGRRRFHILTVVRYKHWTGPIYFNLIRIFNLLLVDRMARSAVPSGNS